MTIPGTLLPRYSDVRTFRPYLPHFGSDVPPEESDTEGVAPSPMADTLTAEVTPLLEEAAARALRRAQDADARGETSLARLQRRMAQERTRTARSLRDEQIDRQ